MVVLASTQGALTFPHGGCQDKRYYRAARRRTNRTVISISEFFAKSMALAARTACAGSQGGHVGGHHAFCSQQAVIAAISSVKMMVLATWRAGRARGRAQDVWQDERYYRAARGRAARPAISISEFFAKNRQLPPGPRAPVMGRAGWWSTCCSPQQVIIAANSNIMAVLVGGVACGPGEGASAASVRFGHAALRPRPRGQATIGTMAEAAQCRSCCVFSAL
jgi:hypothetical protein